MRYDERRAGLVEILNRNGIDAIFLMPSSDLKYVTGADLRPDGRVRGVLLSRDGKAVLVSPVLYSEDSEGLRREMPTVEWNTTEGAKGPFLQALRMANVGDAPTVAFTKGLDGTTMLELFEGTGIRCVSGRSLLQPMRAVKSNEEMDLVRRASHMCDRMMTALAGYIRPGVSERDIRGFIMNFHEAQGGKPRVPMVASDVNSGMPHYYGENNRAIGERDIVMVDSGGWYEEYSHDCTRTFFVGEPTAEQRRVYGIVLEAQLAAEEQVAPGAIPAEIDETARRIIRDEGYGQYFPHRLGHWIGLDGQEGPCVGEENREPLVAGNCLTIEPGIYMRGNFGVRIEDVVMVTEDGREVVNRVSKELMVL